MKPKYVYILWKDAVSIDDWTPRKDIEFRPHVIESIGILIDENTEVVSIACNHDVESDSFSCIINIPRGMIVTITEVDLIKK